MTDKQPKFLAVLPWLKLLKEIEVGPFVFWRWPEDAEKYLPPLEIKPVRDTLNSNFRQLKRGEKRWGFTTIDSLTLVAHKDKGTLCEPETLEERWENERNISMAVGVLCACSIFQTSIFWDFSVVETEPPYPSPNFYKNSLDFAYYDVPLGVASRWGFGSVQPHVRPRECTRYKVGGKDSLFPSLGRLLESGDDPQRNRILRSLTQFNFALRDYNVYNPQQDTVVALATAFELLLDFSDDNKYGKSKRMCLKIVELFQANNKILHKDRLQEEKGKELEAPWKAWWFYRFYGLRNNIVHGKKISYKDFFWEENPYAGTHHEIAIKVFRLTLMKVLLKEGLHSETTEDTYQADKLDEYLSTKRRVLSSDHNLDDHMKWLIARKNK